jgi:hypothetical protein
VALPTNLCGLLATFRSIFFLKKGSFYVATSFSCCFVPPLLLAEQPSATTVATPSPQRLDTTALGELVNTLQHQQDTTSVKQLAAQLSPGNTEAVLQTLTEVTTHWNNDQKRALYATLLTHAVASAQVDQVAIAALVAHGTRSVPQKEWVTMLALEGFNHVVDASITDDEQQKNASTIIAQRFPLSCPGRRVANVGSY